MPLISGRSDSILIQPHITLYNRYLQISAVRCVMKNVAVYSSGVWIFRFRPPIWRLEIFKIIKSLSNLYATLGGN